MAKPGPVHPYIYSFYYTKNTSKNVTKYMGTSLKHIIFVYMDLKKCQIWKRRAPTNDEDPSKNFLKILDMYFISIKKMRWKFGDMYQILFSAN